VRREQRRRPVEHADSLSFELVDDPEAVLDAVELRRHVKSVQCDIAPTELQQRSARREEPAAWSKCAVGLCFLMCNDGKLHALSVREHVRCMGGRAVCER
jgi:hypothetical protein